MQKLFLSHIDAWCIAFVAALVPLWLHDALAPHTLYLAVAITAMYWLAFALNDYFDREHDAYDEVKAGRNFFLLQAANDRWRFGISKPRNIIYYCLLFTIFCSLVFPAFLQFGWRGFFLLVVGVSVMWGYSAPPLRLKSRPILDLLTHTFFVETFPYWSVLFLLELSWLPIDRTFLLIAMLSSFAAQLEQQARDYEIDRLTDRNFTTRFGLSTNLILLRIVTGIIVLFGLWKFYDGTLGWQFAPFALLALPIGVRRFTQREWLPANQQLAYFLALCGVGYAIVLVVIIG